MDWTLIQAFIAVAEAGSLSGGADTLSSSQPTMSRHVKALEDDLSVALFDRTGTGLQLTSAGIDLLEHARAMRDAAGQFALTAGGQDSAIKGTVRITASEVVSSFVLPSVLMRLRAAEPEIEIELVSSDRSENLLQREADIAVRMYRPTQMDVIAKKVGNLQMALFAHKDYLAVHGEPKTIEDFGRHNLVGYDKDSSIIEGFAALGHKVDRNFFAFRCDNQVVCWQMVLAGFGIGFNQLQIGLAEPNLRRLMPEVDMPSLPVWLTAHVALKTSRRVRRVYDFLDEALKGNFN